MKQTKNVLLAVIATGIMAFSGVLIETAMNVTFPVLMEEFNISTALVQWVTTIYLLMIAITVPISGHLIRNYSVKQLFVVSNLLFLVGVLLDFYSPTFAILLFGRILQGMATGTALPLMFHIILTEAPLEKRGMMMGIGTLATALAPAIGPTYGGLITTHLSWHQIYLFLVPILLLSLGLGWFSIIQRPTKRVSKLDWGSFILLAGVFSGLLLFFSFISQWIGLIFLFIGLISLWGFVKRSQGQVHPLLNFEIFKEKKFMALLFCFLVYHFMLLGISFVLPNYIQLALGKDASIAGLAMFPGAMIGAVLAPISGNMMDKMGPKKLLLYGMWGSAFGMALVLIFTYLGLSVPMLVLGHFIFEIGIGFSYSNFITTAMNQLPHDLYTEGNTLFNTLQQFMGGVATAIVAAIMSIFQNINPDALKGTTLGATGATGFLVFLAILGIVVIQKLQKTKLS